MGLFDAIASLITTPFTNASNRRSVKDTNETNRLIAEMANASNEAMAREVNALNYQMFQEGNVFNALQAELGRAFNASEAEKARDWSSEVSQVSRSLAAGLSPGVHSVSSPVASYNGAPSAMSGLGATTGAAAQAARMMPHTALNPVISGVDSDLIAAADLFERHYKNVKDVERDIRDSASKAVQAQAADKSADAARTSAAASMKNAESAENRVEHQNALDDAQAMSAQANAEYQAMMTSQLPARLQADLNLSSAQADALTRQASAALGQVSAAFAAISSNAALQRELQSGRLSYQHEAELRNLQYLYNKAEQDYKLGVRGLNLKSEEIDNAWDMFTKQFEVEHGGAMNYGLDRLGISKLGKIISFGIFKGR